jgi:hypothetical protein
LHITARISEDLQQHRADKHRSATTPCKLGQIWKKQCIFEGLLKICNITGQISMDLQQHHADLHRFGRTNADLHKTARISADLQQHRADQHRSATIRCRLAQICKNQCRFAQNSKG